MLCFYVQPSMLALIPTDLSLIFCVSRNRLFKLVKV